MALDTHAARLSAPVFLIGPARSGTTLMYKALCLHPEVAYISNWVGRFPGMPALARLDAIGRRAPGLRRQAWFREDANAYVYGQHRRLAHRLFPMPVEGEPVFRKCGIPQLAWEPAAPVPDQRAALRRALSAIRAHDGGRVFLNKRIANNRRVPLLIDTFPDARFVLVVRDGRAVAFSLSRVDWWPETQLFWERSTPAQLAAEGRDPWEVCATNWCRELDAIEEGLAVVPTSQVMRTSYEEFLVGPVSLLEGIAGFMGLSPSPSWRSGLSGLDFPDRNTGWQRSLTSEAIATIETVEAAHLARYGYG